MKLGLKRSYESTGKSSMPIVVDASVVVKWFVEEENSDKAED